MTKILPTTANGWVTLIGGCIFILGVFFSVSVYIAYPRNDSVLERLDRIHNDLQDLKSDLDGLKGNFETLKDDVASLTVDVGELKIEVQWIKDLLPRPSAQFPPNR